MLEKKFNKGGTISQIKKKEIKPARAEVLFVSQEKKKKLMKLN
jgi:hypothetical protein